MSRLSKQKACIACTESKRRCDKGLPSCSRCDDRDVDCQYPVIKRRRRPETARPLPFADPSPPPAPVPLQQQQQQQSMSTTIPDTLLFDASPLTTNIWSMPWTDLDFTTPNFHLSPSTAFTLPPPKPAPIPQQHQQSDPPHIAKPDYPRLTSSVAASLAGSQWFLAPQTWRIDHWPAPPRDAYPVSVLTNFTRGLQAWVRRWVMEGHNPFIHRSLYAEGNYFPSTVQDAFAAASVYFHKTSLNEAFVHRILDERATALLASQPAAEGDSMLETRDHLARVHALYVYTIIRLFDGSVGQRAAAEEHLPTLDIWAKQLWQSAQKDAETLYRHQCPPSTWQCQAQRDTDLAEQITANTSAANAARPGRNKKPQHPKEELFNHDLWTWNLWVLSESVRRTWIIVVCTLGVYNALKGKWGECSGGALFTARAGLWDAPSAPRWAALCRETSGNGSRTGRDTCGAGTATDRPGAECGDDDGDNGCGDRNLFVPSLDSDGLLHNAAAVDVDEFARHLFTCIWGLDRVEDWALRTASEGKVNLVY
ncbi:hypothetical protein BDP55DRAFT_733171 [Colletotrichum godetiae]|uniref:Zn(2)-C6 fungal-type domain-containing protein n=1 Tax=Colletotrichum godetiae TaxID=1209918 RepID=A0AAJ0ABI5_9PEZI|nr:uncharacterized protein BDP55DRAFT_733171 [Colletotrichum godetiae]KAK1659534.1 hypothetical protein BDP55DRAFT_733171 [Colletotrichum godetiae]